LYVPFWPIRRRLAGVTLLALCDYLLWKWSLGAGDDVVALVAGVTLVPLVIAFVWLLVLGVARLLADVAQQPRARSAAAVRARSSIPSAALAGPSGPGSGSEGARAVSSAAAPSSKIAA
jgi:hypothetical protein